jgi:hypothetical protein
VPPKEGGQLPFQGSLTNKNFPYLPLQRAVIRDPLIIDTKQPIPPPFIKGDLPAKVLWREKGGFERSHNDLGSIRRRNDVSKEGFVRV